MSNASRIQNDDPLGRRLSEEHPDHIKRIRKNIDKGLAHPCPYKIFKPKSGEMKISVDRLDLISTEKMAAIVKQITDRTNRLFYGWGVVIYRSLPQGFNACPSPDKETANDYHADLYFIGQFAGSNDDNYQRTAFARKLAEIAEWRGYPE